MANWFVAFKVDQGNWFNFLISQMPRDLKIFQPDDLHMTIAFLGNLNLKFIDNITDCIKNFNIEPVILDSRGIIVLPSEKRFSAICLDFQDAPVKKFLEPVSQFRDRILKSAEVKADNRNFLPHVTIARPDRNITLIKKEELLKKIKQIPPFEISIKVQKIALYTWADYRAHRQNNLQKASQFKIVYPAENKL
ncbi:MAG: hypothetical protein OEV78_04760 [Spirochaetia bacterium]|nr:hypothetical protein [Spirochaetia bacterium]